MKRLFYLFFAFLLFACKKEINTGNLASTILQKVKASLKDSLALQEFSNLDFQRALLSKSEANQLYFLRIPFYNKNFNEDFLIVKTDATGVIEKGRIITLKRTVPPLNSKRSNLQWDGNISIRSLSNQTLIQSSVVNGHVTALQPNLNSRTSLVEPVYPDNVMPEVVIVAYVDYGGISYSTWLWLTSLFYNSDTGGGGSGGGYYYGSDGGGGYYGGGEYGGGGATGSYSGSGTSQENLEEFEPEYIYAARDVDVWKMFNCFANVPSAGATYTIKLCADVPANGNPRASSNNSAVSGGHSFLIVTKANGDQKVSQSFGFYPNTVPSILDPFADVNSTIKDNGNSEFNASIEMTISEGQFDIVRNYAISLSAKPYNLGNYNCTNYAMDIFNAVRASPLSIAPYKIILPGTPGYGTDPNIIITIEKSPQMLFTKLQQMKQSNDPEASNITIDQTHNSHAPNSQGECN